MKILFSRMVIQPIIIILIAIILCCICKNIVYKLFSVYKNKENEKKRKTIANLVSNVAIIFISIVALILILQVFGIDTASFVASLGVFSLVVGLALQDLLKDVFSGIMIILEGQYNIGDWVEVNGFKGEVTASSLRTTRLKAYTGEIKIISNRQINELINYSLSKTTVIVDVSVSYDSDIEKVRTVIDSVCSRLQEEGKVSKMECLGMEAMEDSSLVFRIITRANHPDKLPVTRLINEEIFKGFHKNGIEIPYNQLVIHNGKRV